MKHSEKVNRVVFNRDFVEKNPCPLRDSNPRPSDSVLVSTGFWPLASEASSGDPQTRWIFWSISMLPFLFIVFQLFVGLKGAQDDEEDPAVKSQVQWACWATVISWCTYPVVYVLPMLTGSSGKAGLSAEAVVAVQIGYTISDVISKCGVGYLVYRIGLAKSYKLQTAEGKPLL